MKKAVLDIGSNTIRLLIADTSSIPYQKIYYQHRVARLGEGLQQTGMLSDAGMQRGMVVFEEVVGICASYDIEVGRIRAVATAAIREASNGQAYVQQVREALGLNIQVIQGQVEAKLSLLGSQAVLDEAISQDMLLFDMGGASTEFNRVRHGELVDCLSEKLGVVRLTELYLKHNPPLLTEYEAMKAHAKTHFKHVEALWDEDKSVSKYLVGTAGSVTTIAAVALNMADYDADKINNYRLSRLSFEQVRDTLLAMTNAERLAMPAVETGREDVIVAGVAIVDAMFEYWGFTELITVDAGLLEGLLSD